MKKNRRVITLILSIALIAVLMAGCSKPAPEKLVFSDCGWDSIRFHDAVAMYLIKTVWDVDSEEIQAGTVMAWQGLSDGSVDICMELWSDNVSMYKEGIESGKVKELGVNFDDNAQGLYVPTYVIKGDSARGIEATAPDLKTVKDILKYPELFPDPEDSSKGVLYGSISGWMADEILRKKYAAYGLDAAYNYQDPGSDTSLAAAITAAYEKGKPVLAYYWSPTWVTGKFDLTLLEDEPYDEALFTDGLCEFPPNRVTVCVSEKFSKNNPEITAFLSKYQTSSELTAAALAYINDTGASYEDAAAWFIKENPDLIKGMIGEDHFKKVASDLGI